MTWWMLDDALYDSQPIETVTPEALGVHTLMCSYIGKHVYDEGFDPWFTLKRVDIVTRLTKKPPTQKRLAALAGELTEAGMWCADGAGRYRIVEAPPFGKFAGGKELSAKRAAAGRKGGRATAGKRAKQAGEANASSNTGEANAQAIASSNTQAIAQANASSNTAKQNSSNRIPTTLTEPITPQSPPDGEPAEPDVGPAPASSPEQADRLVTGHTLLALRGAWPGKTGRKSDIAPALAEALKDADAATLYGAVVRYGRAVDAGDVLRRDVPTLAEWLQEGQWRRWQPDKPSSYEWGGISRDWIAENITSQVPDGTFTDSREREFWASVKSGESAADTAQRIVDELNARSTR
ncbi:hypothetical protein [Bifidobacterium parmae]|uniref:Uncharacterized protein n=1 Tax=Bifidobacterium parmae TaxID=361854 RepID=A0A2N5IVM7_9BIFI|nr:hypothetical protein [Bifidobacterium parmae]PLS26009.1 hypothetical protein Uis4E_2184 [Bifidobacterium parmae]